MKIVHEYYTADTHKMALAFSAILAVDKGVPSEVKPAGKSWLVIADDGQAVKFNPPKK